MLDSCDEMVGDETGYYLRNVSSTSTDDEQELQEDEGTTTTTKRIFSAHWDFNDTNRLLLCHQSGRLEVSRSGEQENYHVYLRPFALQNIHPNISSDGDKEGQKKTFFDEFDGLTKINAQWDKLVTVPGKPNHLIFLLGVSRRLFHVVLPSTDTTKLLTPQETPVYELYQHSCRITALTISHDGFILASGDERGGITVQLLQLNSQPYDSTAVVGSSGGTPWSALRLVEDPSLHRVELDDTRVTSDSPIYSIVFLPTTVTLPSETNSQTRAYFLATGAADGFVRIWSVQLLFGGFKSSELRITPMLNLSTITTHVLCLNTTLIHSYHDNDNDSHAITSPTTLLSAGTSSGVLYMWKFSKQELERLSQRDPSSLSAVTASTENNLCSMTQVSDRAVIQLCLTLSPAAHLDSTDSSPPPLILTAADISGALHVLHEIERCGVDDRDDDGLFITNPHRIFLPISRAEYDTPIVSCTFIPSYLSDDMGDDGPVDAWRDPFLAAVTYAGERLLYQSSKLFALHKDLPAITETAVDIEYEEDPEPVQMPPPTPTTRHVTTEISTSDPSISRPSLPRVQVVAVPPVPRIPASDPTIQELSEEDEEIEPRVLQVRYSLVQGRVVKHQIDRHDVLSPKPQIQSSFTVSSQAAPLPRHEHQLKSIVFPSKTPNSSVPVSVPPATANTQTQTHTPSRTTAQTQTRAPIPTPTPTSTTCHKDTNTIPKARDQTPQRNSSIDNSLGTHIEAEQSTLSEPRAVHSSIGHATLNFSRFMNEEAKRLRQKVDDDDVTVTTEHTTSTDRHEATRTALNFAQSEPRYIDLPPVDDPGLDSGGNMSRRAFKMRKQVDPNWQRRRQSHLQSVREEGHDLSDRILNLPEPTLDTILTHSSVPAPNLPLSSQHRPKGIHAHKLRPGQVLSPSNKFTSQIHPINGQPMFVNEIPFENIYGSVDEETASLWEHDIILRQMRRVNYLTKL